MFLRLSSLSPHYSFTTDKNKSCAIWTCPISLCGFNRISIVNVHAEKMLVDYTTKFVHISCNLVQPRVRPTRIQHFIDDPIRIPHFFNEPMRKLHVLNHRITMPLFFKCTYLIGWGVFWKPNPGSADKFKS